MQTVSAELTAVCSAAGQRPCFYIEFSWARTGSILGARGATGWTDETSYLKTERGQLSINPPGERLVPAGNVGRATVTLDNTTYRYSWRRADSALYAQIGYVASPAGPVGVPARIWRGYWTTNGAEYVCIFTGVVAEWGERPDGTVVFGLRDWGYVYQQCRMGRAVEEDQLPSQWISTVAVAAGIALAEMSLDMGVFPVGYVWMDDEFAVDEIWTAAECDGGLALFDQRGRLLYWNPLHWVGAAVVWTFDEDSYSLSEPETDADNVATEITVEWSPRFKAADTDVYILDELKTIMPGTTETWVARYNYATTQVYNPDASHPFNDYHAVSNGGVAMNDQITITVSNKWGQQCEIAVHNNSATQAARLVWLRLRGQPLVGGPTEQETATVTPAPLPWPRQRSLRSNTSAGQGVWTDRVQGNVYLQSQAQGRALAELLAVRCRRVRTVWTMRNVPGVPQLELGDRVLFYDNRKLGSGASIEALVIGITWDGNAGSYMQTLRLLDVADLAQYDQYFIIGTTALGGPDGSYGRVWY